MELPQKIYKTQKYIYLKKTIESMEIFEIICCILSDHRRIKLRNQKPETLFDRQQAHGD